MILLIASQQDSHAAAVRRELAAQHRTAELLDLSEFPQKLRLNLHYQPQRNFSLVHEDGRILPLAECRSVWWHWPRTSLLDPALSQLSFQTFACSQPQEAFCGLWQALDARWMNDPTRDESAARKAHQLRAAHEVGLAIPRTLISNDLQEALAFVEGCGSGQAVYRAFSPIALGWSEPHVLSSRNTGRLGPLCEAPVIFQEYVAAVMALRVTIVGQRVFATSMHLEDSPGPAGSRRNSTSAPLAATHLPLVVEEHLLRLMAYLGLVYAVVDLRLTPNAQYVFWEIDPAGQWLLMEEQSGQPITQAVAAQLAAQEIP